jgi:hypothetical protein
MYDPTAPLMFGVIAAIVVILLISLARRGGAKRRAAQLAAPLPGTTRLTCLIVGLGGSGKTTLVNSLTGDPRARPEIQTDSFACYKKEIAGGYQKKLFGKKPINRCTLFISDYNGQRLDQFFSFILQNANNPAIPFKHGEIDCLVFLIDVLPPPRNPGDKPTVSQKIVDERFMRTDLFFNSGLFDAVFGLADGNKVRHVCLFINKVDLLPRFSEIDLRYKYDRIRQELADRSAGKTVSTIIGSAQDANGEAVTLLKSELIGAVTKPRIGVS